MKNTIDSMKNFNCGFKFQSTTYVDTCEVVLQMILFSSRDEPILNLEEQNASIANMRKFE